MRNSEALKEMTAIALIIMAIIFFTICGLIGLLVKPLIWMLRSLLGCSEESCSLYNDCINHEDCGDCIDYDKFIGSEDIK